MTTLPRRPFSSVLLVAAGVFVGALGALAVAPAPLAAEAVDRNEKTVIFTSGLSIGRPGEGVFVLDSTTGTLVGGVIGGNGFTTSYFRNVAADFNDRAGNAEYAVVAGGNDNGGGVIYIAERRSGVVAAYGIPNGGGGQLALVPIGTFNFKAPVQ